MSYALKFTNGNVRTGLASSTACVIYHNGLATALTRSLSGAGFSYLISNGGGSFGVVAQGDTVASATVSLTTETLASVAIRGVIFVDDGNGVNHWRIATVTNDGSGTLGPDGGTIIPSSAAAAVPIVDNSQANYLPALGTQMTLLGTASDGHVLFQGAGQYITCSSQTTVGALSAGQVVIAQVGGAWQVVEL